MTAYIIADVEITDPVAYEEYKKLAPPAISKYGGKILARGGAVDAKEGGWVPSRLVIVEFASMEQARRFYDSPEYSPARALRLRASRSRLVIVDGL